MQEIQQHQAKAFLQVCPWPRSIIKLAVILHESEPGVWYLHIIDHLTHFSAGDIDKTKKSLILR